MKLLALTFLVAGLLAGASPAAAQLDLSGEWAPRFYEDAPERGPGPELGEFYGVPISDAGRWRAESWTASLLTLPEWQCRPHPADYIWRGPSPLSITKTIDPVSREVREYDLEWLRSVRRPIYLDSRDHPSARAPYTWAGFSTGEWKGDMLKVKTDHLKESFVRRNGLPRSDRGTLTEYLIRNGDILTAFTIVHDPVYLTEPYARSTEYELNLKQLNPPYPCHVVEEVQRERGLVPHVLPGEDKSVEEIAASKNIPVEDVRGGASTMYPKGRTFTPTKNSTGASTKPGVPIDITGQWVSVITEDWRWRMATPPKGDYASVPLNPEGIKLVNAWDPASDARADAQCKIYGAAAVLRQPGQIRLSWQDDKVMKLETEAGAQTRLLHFGPVAATAPSLQGVSRANWQLPGLPRAVTAGGQLRVVTDGLTPAYLRKNGVPVSDKARVTEYINRIDDEENGDSWLLIVTVIEDPTYLNQRWFTSSQFKKVVDTTPWVPTPCRA